MEDSNVVSRIKPYGWLSKAGRSFSGRRIVEHIVAWLIALMLMIWVTWHYVTDLNVTDHSVALSCWSGVGNVLIQMALYYWIVTLIVPAALNRRWLPVVVHLVIIYVGSTFGRYYWQLLMDHYWEGVSQRFDRRTQYFEDRGVWLMLVDVYYFFDTWIYTYSIILAPLCIKVIKDVYTAQNRALALELNLLRAQINPHFIFNTLNNIYSIVEEKDEYAGEMLLKFSNIIRYTFNETEHNVIPLLQEINSLKDYIELEKIRYDYDLPVELELAINDTGQSYFIPPLLLISFVENAFKHGANATIGFAWVRIKIVTTPSALHFEVINSKPTGVPIQSRRRTIRVHRVGLKNIKRRLELLYPHTHRLIIADMPDMYSIVLTLTNDGKPDNLSDRRRRAVSPAAP